SYVLTDESVHSSMPELDDVEVDLLSVVPEGDATIPEVPSAYHVLTLDSFSTTHPLKIPPKFLTCPERENRVSVAYKLEKGSLSVANYQCVKWRRGTVTAYAPAVATWSTQLEDTDAVEVPLRSLRVGNAPLQKLVLTPTKPGDDIRITIAHSNPTDKPISRCDVFKPLKGFEPSHLRFYEQFWNGDVKLDLTDCGHSVFAPESVGKVGILFYPRICPALFVRV
ncbi:MAG: hypothetical protein ABIT38_04495, partial [Gemmatimonadaceae bacterium]